jgi:hypothetical protein
MNAALPDTPPDLASCRSRIAHVCLAQQNPQKRKNVRLSTHVGIIKRAGRAAASQSAHFIQAAQFTTALLYIIKFSWGKIVESLCSPSKTRGKLGGKSQQK